MPEIVLEPTTDILAELGRGASGRARSWSASPRRPTTSAPTPEKLAAKRLDLIVANDVAAPGAGFEHDTNAASSSWTPAASRSRCPPHRQAGRRRAVLDAVARRLGARGTSASSSIETT